MADQAKTRRFRFSLKAMLALATVLCLGLGYWVACYRAAAKAVARRNAVKTAIVDQRLAPIEGLPFDRGSTAGLYGKTREAIKEWFHLDDRQTSIAAARALTGYSSSRTSTGCRYDLSGLPADVDLIEVRDRIENHHYAKHSTLFPGGKSRIISDNADRPKCRVSWSNKHNELSVLLDIECDRTSQTATVRILFIESQAVSPWRW